VKKTIRNNGLISKTSKSQFPKIDFCALIKNIDRNIEENLKVILIQIDKTFCKIIEHPEK